MMHTEKHPLANQTVYLKIDPSSEAPDVLNGMEYRIEDWVDRINGGNTSWMDMTGNFAALKYGIRNGLSEVLPLDDEVVYGKINNLGHIIHISEIGEVK